MKDSLTKPVPWFVFILMCSGFLGCTSSSVVNLELDHGGPLAKLQDPLLRRDEEFFSVCFADPALEQPDEDVVTQVLEQSQGVQKDLLWKRVIMTHESGGNPKAISATGSAGLFAIPSKHLSGAPCCRFEKADALEFIYDICNSETVNGYHCNRSSDARFLPSVSFEVADRLLEQFHRARGADRQPTAVDSQESLLAVPIFWNAGPSVILDFPKNMTSVGAVFSRLDFRRDSDYRLWRIHGLVNKWVEVFDHVRWFEFLAQFWKHQSRVAASVAQRTPQAVALPKFNCAVYDPDRLAGGSRIYFGLSHAYQMSIETAFRKVRIKRLKFGDYVNDYAYVGNRSQIQLLPSDLDGTKSK